MKKEFVDANQVVSYFFLDKSSKSYQSKWEVTKPWELLFFQTI
jgi:hypothetical protein